MSAHRLRIILALAALIVVGCDAAPTGDADRGAEVHKACLDCHGTGLYTVPERKVRTLDGLRKEVVRWGDYYAPALSDQDIDDVTAYLNRDYYKF